MPERWTSAPHPTKASPIPLRDVPGWPRSARISPGCVQGLGALGIALAVGRLLPALIETEHIGFGLLGIGYGALGVFLLVMSAYRTHRVRAALVAQRPLPADAWTIWVLTAASLVLGAGTIALIVVAI